MNRCGPVANYGGVTCEMAETSKRGTHSGEGNKCEKRKKEKKKPRQWRGRHGRTKMTYGRTRINLQHSGLMNRMTQKVLLLRSIYLSQQTHHSRPTSCPSEIICNLSHCSTVTTIIVFVHVVAKRSVPRRRHKRITI